MHLCVAWADPAGLARILRDPFTDHPVTFDAELAARHLGAHGRRARPVTE